tara:strand:+ start:1279 stop:1584 length:306 start_codon:yes stop_codon:yes gene_type:complete
MHSLLTEELNNYNNLGKNNKEKMISTETYINKKMINIDHKKMINIDNKNNLENFLADKNQKNENSLNMHIFNPLKNSPPNSWHYRLLNRINSLNNLQNIKT